MGGPLVSVIVPFLDEEAFLGEAIESVRRQTYPDWELLLVDDGSTDGSTALARAAAARDPARVRHLEHPGHANRGTSASRNLGLREARGGLVAYLDGDDLWLPSKLEEQVPALLAHPEAGALYGSCLFWFYDYNNDRGPGAVVRDYVQDLRVRPGAVVPPPRLLDLIVGDENAHPTTCAMLLRREACLAAGGWDDSFRAMYDDSAFLARLLLGTSVLVTGDCTCVYRLHLASTCHQAARDGSYDPDRPSPSRGVFLRWLAGHLRRTGVADRGLRRTVRRELGPYDRPLLHRLAQHPSWRAARRLAAGLRPGAAAPRPAGAEAILPPGGPPPPSEATSAALRRLARHLRATGRAADADLAEERALRVLGRRRSRVFTLVTGGLAVRRGAGGAPVLTVRPDVPVVLASLAGGAARPLGPGAEAEVRLVGAALAAAADGAEAPPRGHVLARGADAAGRVVGFAVAGEAAGEAGAEVRLREAKVGDTLNARLLRAGLAHPVLDPSIPDPYRATLAAAAAEARAAGAGLWAPPGAGGGGADSSWPGLRRALDAFRAGGGRDAADFPAWLRGEGPDEPVLLLPSGEPARLSDLVEAAGASVRLRVRPEEILVFPEEAP